MGYGELNPIKFKFNDDCLLDLIGFGQAIPLGTLLDENEKIGTLNYQAPEILTEGKYLIDKADIYALTCTLITILFFRTVFEYSAKTVKLSPDHMIFN